MSASKAVAIAALTSFLASSTAFAEEKRELDSHEHGHAKLEIAVDGNTMNAELEIPGESIVGFEYAAKTDDENAAVEAAMKTLSDPTAVFTLPSDAGCTVKSAESEIHQDGDHNAFEAEYTFTCTNMAALTGMETKLFTLYPSINEIDVDYATPAGQGSAELEAGSATVTF